MLKKFTTFSPLKGQPTLVSAQYRLKEAFKCGECIMDHFQKELAKNCNNP